MSFMSRIFVFSLMGSVLICGWCSVQTWRRSKDCFTCDLVAVEIKKQDEYVCWSEFGWGFAESEKSQESSQLLGIATMLIFDALQYKSELLKFDSEPDMWQNVEK